MSGDGAEGRGDGLVPISLFADATERAAAGPSVGPWPHLGLAGRVSPVPPEDEGEREDR